MRLRILMHPIPTEGGGTENPPERERITVKGLLNRNQGDAAAALAELYSKALRLQQDLGTARAEIVTLKGKIPGDGTVTVPADKVALWDAVKALKLEPAEVSRMLKEFPTIEAELKGVKARSRTETFAASATVDGKKVDPEVFADLFGDLEMVVEDQKDRRTGKTSPVVYVVAKEGGKDVKTEFGEYAKAQKPKFLPALVASPENSSGDDDEEFDDEGDEEIVDREGLAEDDRPIEGPASRKSILPSATAQARRNGITRDAQRVYLKNRSRYG